MDTKTQLETLLDAIYSGRYGTKNRVELIMILENIINNLK